MIRLFFVALAIFGAYCGLGHFFPSLFHQTFVIPTTTYVCSYATLILAIISIVALTRMTVK